LKNIKKTAATNLEFFEIYCGIIRDLLRREDRDNPAIKYVLRVVVREAANCTSDLPCYDNKLGSKMTSVMAFEKIMNDDLSGLIGDHAVPVSVFNELLLNIEDINTDSIKKIIADHALRVVITEEEDKQLGDSKLKKKMPSDWNGNILARYDRVGIKLTNMSYKIALNEAKRSIQ